MFASTLYIKIIGAVYGDPAGMRLDAPTRRPNMARVTW